ncbi:hypothetical protein ISO73_17960 [Morganella morganii subsp. morganii]|uniref:hypothetical protein n=1 Tax=Morganella morganii TaxID=582 RepID=UPI001BD9E362|nr:hypothetical protein [Morganella morganii]MBT0452134.1 hypothetical protein [Morganella morganii subsp. morganii]
MLHKFTFDSMYTLTRHNDNGGTRTFDKKINVRSDFHLKSIVVNTSHKLDNLSNRNADLSKGTPSSRITISASAEYDPYKFILYDDSNLNQVTPRDCVFIISSEEEKKEMECNFWQLDQNVATFYLSAPNEVLVSVVNDITIAPPSSICVSISLNHYTNGEDIYLICHSLGNNKGLGISPECHLLDITYTSKEYALTCS